MTTNLQREKGSYLVKRNLQLAIAQIDTGYEDMAYELLRKTVEVLNEETTTPPTDTTVEKWVEKILKEFPENTYSGYGDIDLPNATPWLTEIVKDIQSHSLQQAKAEAIQSERSRIVGTELFNLANKVESAIKVVTGHNQIFAEQNKKDLAQSVRVLLAYIKGLSTLQQEDK